MLIVKNFVRSVELCKICCTIIRKVITWIAFAASTATYEKDKKKHRKKWGLEATRSVILIKCSLAWILLLGLKQWSHLQHSTKRNRLNGKDCCYSISFCTFVWIASHVWFVTTMFSSGDTIRAAYKIPGDAGETTPRNAEERQWLLIYRLIWAESEWRSIRTT